MPDPVATQSLVTSDRSFEHLVDDRVARLQAEQQARAPVGFLSGARFNSGTLAGMCVLAKLPRQPFEHDGRAQPSLTVGKEAQHELNRDRTEPQDRKSV